MASRRDELNAYTFARKRTVAAFLQPSPSGSEEGAPRALRAIAPSLVAGALALAAFGAWGMIKPGASVGWDNPGEKVLVGSESTTRYVVLKTDGQTELHPVLNLASAKLLLDPQKFGVLKIDESVLDSGKIPHGPTIGIPYAPDRLPSADDAGTAKLWSVCEQPGAGPEPLKAAFVLASHDAGKVDGSGRLQNNQALYVQGLDGTRYLIDPHGTKYPIGDGTGTSATTDKSSSTSSLNLLVRALFGDGAQPQMVTADWLATLNPGSPLDFPQITGIGAPAGVPGLPDQADKVGMVLRAPSGNTTQQYVVLPGKVARVSDLVAQLLLRSPDVESMYPGRDPQPQPVAAQDFTPDPTQFYGGRGWPQQLPRQANTASASTICSVYRGTVNAAGTPQLSIWADDSYPAPIVGGATSAYVTPGSGLLYREITGAPDGGGSVYLVTDTGLRYSVPSDTTGSTTTTSGDSAQIRLGYGQVQPVPVPKAWSDFLPKGPTLDTTDATQPQGS